MDIVDDPAGGAADFTHARLLFDVPDLSTTNWTIS